LHRLRRPSCCDQQRQDGPPVHAAGFRQPGDAEEGGSEVDVCDGLRQDRAGGEAGAAGEEVDAGVEVVGVALVEQEGVLA
jgi:hypothetical protein